MSRMQRLPWQAIVQVAARLATEHAEQYGPPTLRRVHYLLVSSAEARALGYANTQLDYKQLSSYTTKARDAGTFPELSDTLRSIEWSAGYTSVAALLNHYAENFVINRSYRMPVWVVLIAEKAGVVPIIRSRFDWLDVSSVRGYVSQSHARALAELDRHDGREVVGLYVGDYDPSGLDIERALDARLPYELRRVALTREQVDDHQLPPAPAKDGDSRTAGMAAAHGEAMQVEVDALPAATLLDLLADAIQDVSGVQLDEDGQLIDPEADELEDEARARFAELAEQVERSP